MCGLISKRNHSARCADTYELKTQVSDINRNDLSSPFSLPENDKSLRREKFTNKEIIWTNIRRLSPQEVPKFLLFNIFNLFYSIFFTIEKFWKITHLNFTTFTPNGSHLCYVYIFYIVNYIKLRDLNLNTTVYICI